MVMPEPQTFNWKIGGVGGYGLQAASNLLGKTFLRGGLFVHVYDEFPSIIKGGAASGQVAVSPATLRSHRRAVNLLVCLNAQSVRDHVDEVVRNGWMIYDADELKTPPSVRPDVVAVPVRLTTIARTLGAEKMMRNVVSLGVTLELLGYPAATLKDIIREEYGRKGQAVVAEDLRAVDGGVEFVKKQVKKPFPWSLKPARRSSRMLIAGNEALGLGAIAAGCRFYAGYPMTPSSSLLQFMVKHGPSSGLVVRQMPDEIAVVNAAIGVSFAGARAMVATSGGGFSLMVEAIGLAAMTETPLVMVDAQRPGPSTGLPTWTEQGDLRFVLHAAQGDFPRVVLAPGDVEECFRLMPLAFNLADRYQTPVIVLTDKYLAESWFTTPAFSTRGLTIDRGRIAKSGTSRASGLFARYADSPSGVSARPLPGTPGLPFMANSDEHDQFGLSNEDPDMRITQHSKRLRKLQGIAKAVPGPQRYGASRGQMTILTWGSTKGPVLDALEILERESLSIDMIQLPALSPFPGAALRSALSKSSHVVVVEGNASGQFAGLVREQTGVTVEDQILKSDGRPFEATELAEEFRRRMKRYG